MANTTERSSYTSVHFGFVPALADMALMLAVAGPKRFSTWTERSKREGGRGALLLRSAERVGYVVSVGGLVQLEILEDGAAIRAHLVANFGEEVDGVV